MIPSDKMAKVKGLLQEQLDDSKSRAADSITSKTWRWSHREEVGCISWTWKHFIPSVCQPSDPRLVKIFQRSQLGLWNLPVNNRKPNSWDCFQRKSFHWNLPTKMLCFKWQVLHHSNKAWLICWTIVRLWTIRDRLSSETSSKILWA